MIFDEVEYSLEKVNDYLRSYLGILMQISRIIIAITAKGIITNGFNFSIKIK